MSYEDMVTEETYNPEQNYYFVDYLLIQNGHPEYIEECREEDPSFSYMGSPKWIRKPFSTEQKVQETINNLFSPYPNKVLNLRIRSEEDLNEIIVIDEKTNERLYSGHEDFEKGLRITQREYDFGRNYQNYYERVTGKLTDNGDSK